MTSNGNPSIDDEVLEPGLREGSEPPSAAADAASNGSGFSLRVLVYFLTQVVTAGLGLLNGFLLASLIGPDGRGEFYLLTFYPTTLMVIGQLGLPQAFTFFTARRLFGGLIARSIAFAIVIGSVLIVATAAFLPELEQTFLRNLEAPAILGGLVALPFMLNANFTTGIVVGRQSAFGIALIYVGVNALTTILILVLVGGLHLGVIGALIGFVLSAVALALAFLWLALRSTREVPSEGGVGTRRLFGYGLPFFPASLSQFFAARTDVFLLAALLADPAAPLGYYSLAVAIAELVFLFPNAVSTFFFPHVAGGIRAESDRQVGKVARVTLILTGLVGILLAPAVTIAIMVIIPTFTPALPALYILLAGATVLGPTRVLAGYIAGLGRPGLASAVNLGALGLNVVLNITAIPLLGIVGAALAMLASSLLSSLVSSAIAARLSGERLRAFWLPRMEDVRFIVATGRGFLGRLIRRGSASA